MGGFPSNPMDTAMSGSGMGNNYMGGNQNPLLALAGSNTMGGVGSTMSGGPNSGIQGANSVINMIKQLRDDQKVDVNKFEAVVQFVWIPKTPTEREEAKKAAEEKLKADQTAAQGTDESSPDDETTADAAAITSVNTDTGMADSGTVTNGNDVALTGQPDSQAIAPVTPPVTLPDDTPTPSDTPDDSSSDGTSSDDTSLP